MPTLPRAVAFPLLLLLLFVLLLIVFELIKELWDCTKHLNLLLISQLDLLTIIATEAVNRGLDLTVLPHQLRSTRFVKKEVFLGVRADRGLGFLLDPEHLSGGGNVLGEGVLVLNS